MLESAIPQSNVWKNKNKTEDERLAEFMYLVFTRMPKELQFVTQVFVVCACVTSFER